MASLADLPELVGFFSYSRRDDEHSEGALSRRRSRIHGELRLQLGRDFRLWQDTEAIPDGALWEDAIKRAIAESVLFIPIVTPSAVGSKHCQFEFESFLEREAALGRNNLIFPLLYVRVPGLEKEEEWRHDKVLKIIGARQYSDWQKIRHRGLSEPAIAEKIEQYCQNIVDTLRQPWVSLEEQRAAQQESRRQDEEAAALRSAERQQLVRQSEERAHLEEARRLAREAQERREAGEKELQHKAADAVRAEEALRRQEVDAARRARKPRTGNPPRWAWLIGGATIAVVVAAVLLAMPTPRPPVLTEQTPAAPVDATPSGKLTASGRPILEFGQDQPQRIPEQQSSGEFTAMGRAKLRFDQ
jgi:hypothetical protein